MKIFVVILSSVLLLSFVNSTNELKYFNEPMPYKISAKGFKGQEDITILHVGTIYSERWDTLAHVNFWRKTMNLDADTALVNIASTRTIVGKIAISNWKTKTELQKTEFKDSIRKAYNLTAEEIIYFTAGKNFFYKFEDAIPDIHRAIPIFEDNNVDPFYAQAILLIESPGRLQKSNVGAYGSFQLMKGVAKNMGLKVNKHVDERKNFEKSAWAAAKLIRTACIPYANSMLEKRGISYNQKDLWYRLLVLHIYHAGAGNVAPALDKTGITEGGKELILKLWQTKCANFGNASQNYSQIALAALIETEQVLYKSCKEIALK
jgi:hypothetical protein